MICPTCGFENIQGVDECENCGPIYGPLTYPLRERLTEAKLVGVPLSEVNPHRPMTIASSASSG